MRLLSDVLEAPGRSPPRRAFPRVAPSSCHRLGLLFMGLNYIESPIRSSRTERVLRCGNETALQPVVERAVRHVRPTLAQLGATNPDRSG